MTQLNFYNTIMREDEALRKSEANVQTQGARVLAIMNKLIKATPAQVHKVYCKNHKRVPITSIRRAMTDLTTSGDLVKTGEKGPGAYGMENFKWEVV